MGHFKKKRVIHNEFSYEDLPHNRFEVFKTLFRIRFGFIAKITGITILFCLPLIAWNTYGRLLIRTILVNLSESNHVEIFGNIYGSLVVRFLVNIPLFFLSFIGLGGMIRVFRKLTWSEITFVSDYFDNLKSNLLRYLFSSFFLCLSYHVMLFALYSIKAINMQPLLVGIMLAFCLLEFAFCFIFCFYFLLQNDIYKISFIHLINNSFKFVFKSFLPFLGLLALLFLPRLMIVFGNFYLDLASSVIFVFLIAPISIGLVLVGNYELDKWINKDLYKEIFDKGIYR